MPYDRPRTVVFWQQRSQRNSNGITLYGGDKCRWSGLKLATLKKMRCKSKKVEDRRIVSIKVLYEVIYALSNSDVSDNLGWPLTPKPTKFLHLLSPFISLYWVNVEISNLVHRSVVTSPSIWTTTVPKRGVVTSRDPFYRATASAVYAVVMCPSISHTLRYCIKTAKCMITQIKSHDSDGILVFWCQKITTKFKLDQPYGATNASVG